MGSIVYEFEEDWVRDQYDYDAPIPVKSYAIYCDRCGSFRVVDQLNPIFVLALVGIGAGGGYVWKELINASTFKGSGLGSIFCWGLFALIGLVLVVRAWTYGDHSCLKCGNTKITCDDPLSYSSRNWSQLMDTPEPTVHKHGRDKGKWYDDLVMVPAFIGFVLAVGLLPLVMMVIYFIKRVFRRDPPR